PMASLLGGVVEVDETYVGGKPRANHEGQAKRGRGTEKQAVMVLVERDGSARSMPIERVDGHTLKQAIRQHVSPSSTIMTDELPSYVGIGKEFLGGHFTVTHSHKEYVRRVNEGTDFISTNTAESYFALLKRGHYGIFHHFSKKHLHLTCRIAPLMFVNIDAYNLTEGFPRSWRRCGCSAGSCNTGGHGPGLRSR
ncbi:MAG: IS1595 family transposase, partial [Actinomycetota bacterium]|nr:IS1595 family transposase [Actinomycetota bacterium]